ncbi:uncharacterized protein LOC126100509 [Schistocerca cancellata]|uniref:uncharacterized protein LOC126100509 n=1 Tax=Schistocerca cancellata TaxID=274614 RepID=UPI002117CF51|nr:uncharacterized protein LOC126100509 [Schistocerca cancellata]
MPSVLAVLLCALALFQAPEAAAGQDVPIEGMDPEKMEILRQVVAAAPDRGDAIQMAMRAVFDEMRRAARAQGGERKATPTAALQAALDRGGGLVQQADDALQKLAKELTLMAKQTATNFTSCLVEEREHLAELEAVLGSETLSCLMGGVRLLAAIKELNGTARGLIADAKSCSKLDDTLVKIQCRSQLLVELGPELLSRTAELKEAAAEDAEAVADQVEALVQKCLPVGSPLDLEVQDLLTDMGRCTASAVAAAEGRRETPREDL